MARIQHRENLMPSKNKPGRKSTRMLPADVPVVVAFGRDTLRIPSSMRVPLDDGQPSNLDITGQAAWVERHVYHNPDGGPADLDRKRALFTVLFMFPDAPGAMGECDPNFTCRSLESMIHYIRLLYQWPDSVRQRFPGGVVRFHELEVLDHNNCLVLSAAFDVMLFSARRLALPPAQRHPVCFKVLCYRFDLRASNVNVAMVTRVGGSDERSTHTVCFEHQTFMQLLYGIHRSVGRVDSFYTHQDEVEIRETSLEGLTHVVTLATYGTVIYCPDAPLEVSFRCRDPAARA